MRLSGSRCQLGHLIKVQNPVKVKDDGQHGQIIMSKWYEVFFQDYGRSLVPEDYYLLNREELGTRFDERLSSKCYLIRWEGGCIRGFA